MPLPRSFRCTPCSRAFAQSQLTARTRRQSSSSQGPTAAKTSGRSKTIVYFSLHTGAVLLRRRTSSYERATGRMPRGNGSRSSGSGYRQMSTMSTAAVSSKQTGWRCWHQWSICSNGATKSNAGMPAHQHASRCSGVSAAHARAQGTARREARATAQ